MDNKRTKNTSNLVEAIIAGIREKKGNDIVDIDFAKLQNSVCQHFVVCDAESNTQVDAIANSVREIVKERLSERVHRYEGMDNSQWVLLDYVDVVVHIFQKESREFYNLEDLWADGEITTYGNEE